MGIYTKTTNGWEELGCSGGGAAGAPNATGGDEVKEVGGYRYHLFTNSGDLIAIDQGEYEILAVGAGGGGGWGRGGGGGAGAVEPASGYAKQTLTPGPYTVTIADGGSAGTGSGVVGGTPSATSFDSISANGGGGGGSAGSPNDGAAGGSGGGSEGGVAGGAIGSNTNPGGKGGGGVGGGGGGGATDKGGDYFNGAAGNGGEGLALVDIDAALTPGNFTTFSGRTHVASGGGGGALNFGPVGTGGTGAGNGASNGSSPGGTATSFGCGGGGGGQNGGAFSNGGKGYQGLVIVRYAL